MAVLSLADPEAAMTLAQDEACPPRATILIGESTARAVPEDVNNLLQLCSGKIDAFEGGYYGEGSARAVKSAVEPIQRSAVLTAVIDWVGSSLGHPRDGVLHDDSFIYPLLGILRFLPPLLLVLCALPLYWLRKKT